MAHIIQSSLSVTGSITVQGAITGSVTGSVTGVLIGNASTATSATTATSASFATTASYWSGSINNVVSSSYATTASYWSGSIQNATSASFASTASYWSGSIQNATSASFATTASYFAEKDPIFTAKSASFATTGSNAFTGSIVIAGNLDVQGTASIAYLNVLVESSSVIYSSGSNQFGDATNDRQTIIGFTTISGSLSVTGSSELPNITGSLKGNADTATTASYSATASYWSGSIQNATSASYSTTASYWSGSIQNALSASYATSASWAPYQTTASYALTASYWSGSVTNALSSSYSITASYWSGSVTNALSSSYSITASYWSGSVINAQSASYSATASYAASSVSSSYATTASYWSGSVTNATSASYALTASYVANASSFPYTGSATISGSLSVIGQTTLGIGTSTVSNYQTVAGQYNIATSGAGAFIIGNGSSVTPNNLLVAQGSIVQVTGSTQIQGGLTVNGHQYQPTASYALTASYLSGSVISSSYSVTASYWSGSIVNATSASYAVSASYAPLTITGLTNKYIPRYSGSKLADSILLSHDDLLYTNTTAWGSSSMVDSSSASSPLGLFVNARSWFDPSPQGAYAAIGFANAYIDDSNFFDADLYTFRTQNQFIDYGIKAHNNTWVKIGDYADAAIGQTGVKITLDTNAGNIYMGDKDKQTLGIDTTYRTVSIGNETLYPHVSLTISGSTMITGSVYLDPTHRLFGTASHAISASWAPAQATSSYALTASYWSGSVISASYAATASYLLGSIASASYAATASQVISASYATQALSASYVSGSVIAPGSTTQIIYNNGGVLEANSGLVYSGSNIGIGTTTPIEKLDVNGNALIKTSFVGTITAFGDNYASFSHTSRAGTNNYSLLSDNVGVTYLNASSSQNIRFRIDNIDKAILDNNGNFGIATTTPNAKLDVNGNAIITGSLTVTGGITGSLLGSASYALTSSYSTTALNASTATTASYVLPLTQSVGILGSVNVTGSLGITGSLFANNMLYVTGGMVGVNSTLNSGFPFDIAGNVRIQNIAYFGTAPNGSYISGDGYDLYNVIRQTGKTFVIGVGGYSSTNQRIQFKPTTTTNWDIETNSSTGAGTDIVLKTGGSTIATFINPKESSGNIQLGPSGSDSGYKVQIITTGSVTSQGARSGSLQLVNTLKTSGSNVLTYNSIVTNTTIQCTEGTTLYRGFYHNPILSSSIGVTHRAIETATGDVVFGSTSGNVSVGKTTANAKLDVFGNTTITGSTQITGSLFVNGIQIPTTASSGTAFPYTGSAGISGSLAVDGPITYGVANGYNQSRQTSLVQSANNTTVTIIETRGNENAVFIDYVVVNDSNIRAGNIIAASDQGAGKVIAETSTSDIGDTSPVTFDATVSGGTLAVTCTTATTGWLIKTIVRVI